MRLAAEQRKNQRKKRQRQNYFSKQAAFVDVFFDRTCLCSKNAIDHGFGALQGLRNFAPVEQYFLNAVFNLFVNLWPATVGKHSPPFL